MRYISINTPGDGSCLFHAAAMGVFYNVTNTNKVNGLRNNHIITMGRQLRKTVLDYILEHRVRYQRMLNKYSSNYNHSANTIEEHVKHMRNHKVYAAAIEVDALRKVIYESFNLRLQIFIVRKSKKMYDSNEDFVETLTKHSGRSNMVTLVLHSEHYTLVVPSTTNNISFAY